ncbi:MAG: hypothetical protein ACI9U2_001522 [Bradymonadia bacterium]|jgi:hypothetical protein
MQRILCVLSLLIAAGCAWAAGPDTDGDGIANAVDKCPNDPEDRDGFQDADGCPDLDNDADRILDVDDKCPNQPETYNGKDDTDGCPDGVGVKISARKSVTDRAGGSAVAPGVAHRAPESSAPASAASARTRRHAPRARPMSVASGATPVAGARRAPARRAPARRAPTPAAIRAGGKAPLQIAAPSAGRLTAGEWRDVDHWQFWSDLRRRQSALTPDRALAQFDLVADHLVTVSLRINARRAAVDVPVRLYDGSQRLIAEGRTNAFGQAHLVFGSAKAPLSLDVVGKRHAVQPGAQLELTVDAPEPAPILDVMLVVDVTGSMCDELSWLQREMTDVLERALEATPNLALRTSANAYRDHGDQFLVKPAPFRKTPGAAIADLNAVACGGGGDTPEAVDDALVDALEEHDWSPSATGRLLFLVLDAPPHQTGAVKARLKRSIAAAQKKGVRIIAVAGSGIDKTAEFFLRGASALTGGTYVFLTNHSGIGNSHIKPTVGPHAIEALNDLMVRLIREAAGVKTDAEHAAGQ